jgi:hypothetical protein
MGIEVPVLPKKSPVIIASKSLLTIDRSGQAAVKSAGINKTSGDKDNEFYFMT